MTGERSAVRPGRLIGLLLVAVMAAALVFWLHRALDPAAVRHEAEDRLSAMVGHPVVIGDLRVSVLPRPALVGTAVRVGEEERVAPAVSVDRIRLVPRLRPLLTGRLVFGHVQLDGLEIAVLRDAEGGWHAPVMVPPEMSPDRQPRVVVDRISVREGRVVIFDRDRAGGIAAGAGIEDVRAELVSEPGVLILRPFSARIGEAVVSGDARIQADEVRLDLQVDDVRDGDVPALLALAGAQRTDALRLAAPASGAVSMRVDPAGAVLSGTGSIGAPDVRLDGLVLEGLEASVTIDGRRFLLEPTRFALHGGTHDGAIAIDLSGAPGRWSLDSTVEGLDVGDFLLALTGADQRLDGRGSVGAAVRGRLGDPLEAMEGTARVVVTDGVVRDLPLLAALHRALRLPDAEARDTRFDRLSATLVIGGGHARTDDLRLEGRDMRVAASGRIGFDRSLDLSGHAIFSDALSAAMVRSVRELAAMQNPDGEIEVPIAISGTMDEPQVGFDLRPVLGQAIEDELRRRLRDLLRPPGGQE